MADTITLRADPETLERLDRLAKATERSRNYIVNVALKAYLGEQAWQIEAIREGIASLDAGEAIPDEELDAHFRRRLQDVATEKKAG